MDEPNRGKRVQKIMKSPHYQALQVKFAYSVTCHKSQGGQWPVVFIDQGYLTDEMVNLEYQRWLYTALTRATERVYLVNFNEQFIGIG
jgi:exodeoxyribonuclease V